jgi:hypothetical protein
MIHPRILLVFFCWLFAWTGVAMGADFFVATNGNDMWSGSLASPNAAHSDGPFATLKSARDAMRRARATGRLAGGGTVWIRGGIYSCESSFELTALDSGGPRAPILYRAYSNEIPRLVGGRKVGGFAPVTDDAAKMRLALEARAHVLQVNLREQGVTNFGRFQSRGFGRPTSPAHLELFFDGEPMTLARWPNQGEWQFIAGFPTNTARGDDHGGKIGELGNGFHFTGDRPRRWQSTGNWWIHGYWAWDWANSYERIESLDLDQRLIKTAAPHGLYGFRKGQRFYFVNVLEELDQPGEWFLDPNRETLYFWPPKPTDSAEALVSLLEGPLLALNNVSNVTFVGLVLEATRGNAVQIDGGVSNRIADCVLRLIGNNGVTVRGGFGHAVIGCNISDTGDGGVSLQGGDRQTLTAAGCTVENCHFQRQGRWSKCYVPAVLLEGVGHRVANNLIHDHPHCAILFSGNEHRIEFNEIHHVALETGDVGAIYAGRDWTFRGNRIRYNFIHHTGGVGMGSMGVYMDDCVSGAEIYGNTFYKVTRAVFLGGGRDHRVENNVFYDCRPAVQIDGRGLDPSPVWHSMVFDYMKKQMAAVPLDLYRRRYPELASLDSYYAAGKGVPPENNVVRKNISVGGEWLSVHWHADRKWIEITNNLVDVDPGFIAPDKMDFRLKPSLPAERIGFEPIPSERIGLRPKTIPEAVQTR